ncbi:MULTISPECIES: DUF2256 domain-containing protein [unclassified Marinomonas]|uniref:DUF2256 domain-containing protein n=1 Tax=unclassified Marinomonas TaxID=196814 RepID=UPI002F90FDEA
MPGLMSELNKEKMRTGLYALIYRQITNLIHMKHRKAHLPQKTCQSCKRPFSWRKKWQKDWEQVKYCSKRCRNERHLLIESNDV